MGKRYSLNIKRLDDLVSTARPEYTSIFANGKPSTEFSTKPTREAISVDIPQAVAENETSDPGWLASTMDFISRPRYALFNVLKDWADPSAGTDNPFESLWAGLSGVDKTSGSDVISEFDKNNDYFRIGKGVTAGLGTGLDIVGDPLNYIPFGKAASAIGKVGKAIDYTISGDKAIAKGIKEGKISPRYTEAQAEAKGLGTQQTIDAELVDAPDITPSQGRLNDITYEEGTPNNPREGGWAPEDKANPFEPNKDSPANPFTQAATHEHDRRVFFGDSIQGRPDENIWRVSSDGNVHRYTPEGVPEDFFAMQREHQILATPKKELMPGKWKRGDPIPGTVAPESRMFEVSPAVAKTWDETPNDIPQSYLLAEQSKALNAEINNAKLYSDEFDLPKARTQYKYQGLVTGMKEAKQADMTAGKAPAVNLDGEIFHLHMSDVIDSLPAQDFIRMHMNVKSKIAPSSILKGAAAAVKGTNLGYTGENLFAFVRDHFLKANKTALRSSNDSVDRAVRALIKSTPKLQSRLILNEGRIRRSDFSTGRAIGGGVANEIKRVIADPTTSASKELVRVADLYGSINREARAAGLGPGEALMAGQTAREALGGAVDALDVGAARDTLAATKASLRGDQVAVRARLRDTYIRDAEASAKISSANAGEFAVELARNTKPGEFIAPHSDLFADLMDKQYDDLLNGFQRVYRTARRALVASAEQGKLAGVRRRAQSAFGYAHAQYQREIQAVEKEIGREQFDRSFEHVWSGADKKAMSAADQKAYDMLYPLMKDVVDPASGFLNHAALRVGIGIDAYNKMMAGRGLKKYQILKEYNGKTYHDSDLAQAYLDQVRSWKVDDPMNFLARLNGVAADAASFHAIARAAEMMGSKNPKEGHSRIAASADFDQAPVSHFIDQSIHIPNEIIEQLRVMNQEFLKPVNWGKQKGAFATFMNKIFDPMLRAWKSFNTVLRPGHHIANIMGDTMVNFLDKVGIKHYKIANEAMRSVGLVGRQQYDELIKVFTEGRMSEAAYKGTAAKEFAFTVELANGQKVHLTNGQVGESIYRNGGLSDFMHLEDVQQVMDAEGKVVKSPINSGLDKILNSRYGRVLEKASEWNSNTQRAAQAIRWMSDAKWTKQFNSLDEAWGAAIEKALRSHPDSAGLAAFEKRWMRRIIPFYSYHRQILPWTVMNFVSHPGRSLVLPKIQYGMQEMNGQEPQSLGFPFQNPSVLPQWALSSITGNVMGDPNDPGGLNFGYGLSSPLETMGQWTNQYGESGPTAFVKAAAGSVNPMLTLPFRLAQDKADKSEEWDKTIPGFSQINSVLGTSPTGTIGNVLSGVPQIDQTRQVANGNKNMLWNESLLNFLTGLRIADYSDYSGPGASTLSVRNSPR